MASWRFTNVGEGTHLLGRLVNKTAQGDLKLKLYQDNEAFTDAKVAADYTEATFTGYAAVTLTGSSWSLTLGDPSHADYAQQTFLSSADQAQQTIYGALLTTAGDIVIAVLVLDAPQVIQNNGDAIKITPVITGKDEGD